MAESYLNASFAAPASAILRAGGARKTRVQATLYH